MPGQAIQQPIGIEHFAKTAFSWEGGDPVVDFPHVVMQHADGTPVKRANGEIIDTFYEMHLKYRLVNGRQQWTVEFEAPKDWVPGDYQFAVDGKATQAAEQPYALTSQRFHVAGSPSLQISTPKNAGGNCEVSLAYTPR